MKKLLVATVIALCLTSTFAPVVQASNYNESFEHEKTMQVKVSFVTPNQQMTAVN